MSLFNRQELTAILVCFVVYIVVFDDFLTACLSLGSLLLRRECCTFSNGEYVKSGLAELEKWIGNTGDEASRIPCCKNFLFGG